MLGVARRESGHEFIEVGHRLFGRCAELLEQRNDRIQHLRADAAKAHPGSGEHAAFFGRLAHGGGDVGHHRQHLCRQRARERIRLSTDRVEVLLIPVSRVHLLSGDGGDQLAGFGQVVHERDGLRTAPAEQINHDLGFLPAVGILIERLGHGQHGVGGVHLAQFGRLEAERRQRAFGFLAGLAAFVERLIELDGDILHHAKLVPADLRRFGQGGCFLRADAGDIGEVLQGGDGIGGAADNIHQPGNGHTNTNQPERRSGHRGGTLHAGHGAINSTAHFVHVLRQARDVGAHLDDETADFNGHFQSLSKTARTARSVRIKVSASQPVSCWPVVCCQAARSCQLMLAAPKPPPPRPASSCKNTSHNGRRAGGISGTSSSAGRLPVALATALR